MSESIEKLGPEDAERMRRLLTVHPWIFAKTAAKTNPHHYTLRSDWDKKDFEWVIETLRANGYTERFWGKDYTMFSADGFKYWTMGAPVFETILINRKPLSCP